MISLEPGASRRRAMGLRAMAEDRGPRVVEAAYEETRRRILSTPFLARWASRAPRPPPADPDGGQDGRGSSLRA